MKNVYRSVSERISYYEEIQLKLVNKLEFVGERLKALREQVKDKEKSWTEQEIKELLDKIAEIESRKGEG